MHTGQKLISIFHINCRMFFGYSFAFQPFCLLQKYQCYMFYVLYTNYIEKRDVDVGKLEFNFAQCAGTPGW